MDVLVDIDGTLADVRHRLHLVAARPKNRPAFFDSMADDPPIERSSPSSGPSPRPVTVS